MMATLLITQALLAAEPCPFIEPTRTQAKLEVTQGTRIRYQRGYVGSWALCGKQSGDPPPTIRLSVDVGKGWELLAEKSIRPTAYASDTFERSLSITEEVCGKLPRPPKGERTLVGAAGQEFWAYTIPVRGEVVADGAFKAIAHEATGEILCRACPRARRLRAGIAQVMGRKGRKKIWTLQLYAEADKAFTECVGTDAAHRMHLRVFAGPTREEAAASMEPVEEFLDLHKKLKPVKGQDYLRYEKSLPHRKFCKMGEVVMVEKVGLGEYYSSRDRRWPIDPFTCDGTQPK